MKKLLTMSIFCALAMSVMSCGGNDDNGRSKGKKNNRCKRCTKCITQVNNFLR